MNIAIAAVYAKDWIAVARSDRPKLTQTELSRVLRSGVTALDIRIESLGRGPSRHEMALAAAAHEAGVEVRCHSWTGLIDGKTGVSIADMSVGLIQGEQARAACRALNATQFGCNSENHVWRGPFVAGERRGGNPHADDFHRGLGRAFRIVDCAPRLEYVGYADPAWHYRPADLDNDGVIDTAIPPDVRAEFNSVGVMTYQSSIPAHDAQLTRASRIWVEHSAPSPRASRITPWVGVGRIDAKDGTIGNADASIALARRYGRITFYVGGGAMGQLLRGHPGHRPIVQIIDELKPKVQA